jgi:hypothetical protein
MDPATTTGAAMSTTTTRTRRPRTPKVIDEQTITIDQARRLLDAAIDAEARAIAALGVAQTERAACEARVARIEAERRAMLAEARQATLRAAR